MVVGYGFLPSKSATIGKTSAEIAALCRDIWGDDAKPGLTACKTNAAGGRSYLLPEKPDARRSCSRRWRDAGVHPALEVLEGKTDGWLHVLHRVKDGRDVFLVVQSEPQGAARQFKFRATAAGEPEVLGRHAERDHRDPVPADRRPAGGVLADAGAVGDAC